MLPINVSAKETVFLDASSRPVVLINLSIDGILSLSRAAAKVEQMPFSPILIKRYARSRLYDTSRPRYVTVDELRDWERKGIIFTVLDVETGEDITRVLLA